MRACPDCKKFLPTEAFARNPTGRDGLQTYCRLCSAARSRAWAAANKEAVSVRKRAYYEAHKGSLQAQRRTYYEKNKRRILDSQRKPPEENRERVKAWAQKNPDKRKAQLRRKVAALTDGYLRALLTAKTDLLAADIPPPLVELKREQLTTRRLALQLKKATTNESSKDTR